MPLTMLIQSAFQSVATTTREAQFCAATTRSRRSVGPATAMGKPTSTLTERLKRMNAFERRAQKHARGARMSSD